MHDQTHDGLIDNLSLVGGDISGNHWFSFSVTADQIGQNLLSGSYADARRANVGIVGHAGLDFSTDGRGSNQVFGSFVINDIAVDYSGSAPYLVRFSATFEQHSESPTAPVLNGNITYGEPDTITASTIIELPGQGSDHGFSSVSYALPANVEDLTLTGLGDVSGTGNILANALSGNIGNNLLVGGEGNDSLSGGGGNDNLSGGGDNDTLDGGLGADWLQGDAGTDTVILTPDGVWSGAYVGFNVGSPLTAGTGQTVSLTGMNRFSDVVDGGSDTDTVQLTNGNDAYFLHDAFSGFTAGVGLAADVRGQASAARGLSIEQILAGGGNDLIDLTSANYSIAGVTVDGGSGNDILWGNAGNDTLLGGEGNDTLFGGAGNDSLTGGSGADVFQFVQSGGGTDQITDFDTAQDKLVFHGMTSLSELTSQVVGADLALNWNGQSITLQGVTDAPNAGWVVLA
jgi:Ca2+-binding RTX toxin-like protein